MIALLWCVLAHMLARSTIVPQYSCTAMSKGKSYIMKTNGSLFCCEDQNAAGNCYRCKCSFSLCLICRMFLTRGVWSILNCMSLDSSTSSSTRGSSSSALPRVSIHPWCCFLSPMLSCLKPLRAPESPSLTTRPLRSLRQQPWSL